MLRFFNHFFDRVTKDDCLSGIDKMYTKSFCSILDYSVEGKEKKAKLDAKVEKVVKPSNLVKKKGMSFAGFKLTGFGRFPSYQKITRRKELLNDEKSEWLRIIARFKKVYGIAQQKMHLL